MFVNPLVISAGIKAISYCLESIYPIFIASVSVVPFAKLVILCELRETEPVGVVILFKGVVF